LVNCLPVISRQHDDLRWRDHVYSAVHFDRYNIPIEYDGSAQTAWDMPVSGAQCRQLLERDWLAPATMPANTFPYTQESLKDGKITLADVVSAGDALRASAVVGGVGIAPRGESVIITSEFDRARPTGSVRLHLKRNDRLAFFNRGDTRRIRVEVVGISGFFSSLPPTLEPVALRFGNERLPAEFDVIFVDDGPEPQQSFGIQLRR
jgi:hypothetical protein